MSPLAHEARALVRAGRPEAADAVIPAETAYPLAAHLASRVAADVRRGGPARGVRRP